MGNSESPKNTKHNKSEEQIIEESTQMVTQLSLYNSDQELNEQKHLFARIMIYGHSHLISQLGFFPKPKQKELLAALKVDYETIDLLFQNLVANPTRKDKNHYQSFNGVIQKVEQERIDPIKYKLHHDKGLKMLSKGKVAILIFAAGSSSRFKTVDGEIVCKQLYTQKEDQKCLLQISLQKASALQHKFPVCCYLVHKKQTRTQVNKILQKFPILKIKKIIQTEIPIVSVSGKMCLKDHDGIDILRMPEGCGNLASLQVRGVRLLDEMIEQGIDYVCTLGIENICAQPADPYMIGVLACNESVSVAFQCTYANSEDQNLKRVVFSKGKQDRQHVEVDQLETLLEKCNKNCIDVVKESPVWVNNMVFKLPKLLKYLQTKREKLNLPSIFTAKKITSNFWNPMAQVYENQQPCYMFERELTSLLLNEELICVGVMVERETGFAPVFTISQEWGWADAYNQYIYRMRHNAYLQNPKRNMENLLSIATVYEMGEI